jgi:hypothetical protein
LTPFKRRAAFACAFLLLIDLIVYFLTRAPVVQFIDSGELALVCQTLGIAHPTGYPLYTLLGRLFCLIPFEDTVFRVGLMSLVFVCLANLALFFILLSILEGFSKREKMHSGIRIWSALIACLTFSLTPTLWSQATSNEVYSLSVLFYGLIILLILRWRRKSRELRGQRIFYLLVFVYALSFGNHMSTVLLLPGILFLAASVFGRKLLVWRRLILIPLVFLLGLSVYFFLPIRSLQNPVADWGNPETWSALVRHITGWQYQVWMFAGSAQELGRNLGSLVKLFFHQFPPYFLPLSLLGMWKLFAADRKILIFLLILFFANILYGINYGISDIDPYFLGSFLVNAIFIGSGLCFALQIVMNSRIKRGLSHAIVALPLLLPLLLLKTNYFEADRSRDFFAYDFASNVMRSVKKDAVILTNVWDHYSPWLYLRFVELKRPDVSYLDTELCRRTWYFDYVEQNYDDLYRTSQVEIKRFLKEVQPFENSEPFEPQVIEDAYVSMLKGFLSKNFKNRPLYDDLIGGPQVGRMYLRVPEGMVFSLKDSLRYYPYEFPHFKLRGVSDRKVHKGDRTGLNLRSYPLMIDLRLRYLSEFKQEEEARALLNRYQTLLGQPIR